MPEVAVSKVIAAQEKATQTLRARRRIGRPVFRVTIVHNVTSPTPRLSTRPSAVAQKQTTRLLAAVAEVVALGIGVGAT
jgi:hypothetical protein